MNQFYMTLIINKELSYKIIGCVYDMFNEVGFGYQEKHYQLILAEIFKNNNISSKKELFGKIIYNDVTVGKYYLDFLVDNKIVVELKVANNFYTRFRSQVLTYLKANNLKLGILVLITKDGIKYERLLNSQYSQ